MFYRVQPSGDHVRGTGLGLYIVESVIKSHGGTVHLTSDGLGMGSIFTIKLPAV
jgi:signal transduction histidine kinase